MPRGSKEAYTDKQKRQAEHIEKGYEERGTSEKEAERRAWATVNKVSGGGQKSGSGVGKSEDHSPMRKGGKIGGEHAGMKRRAATKKSTGRKKPPRKTNSKG
jgi:plasmid stabilization system protein ParE